MADPTPRLAVLGLGRSGKDTAARWLARWTPLRYAGSTSEFLAPDVARKQGLTPAAAFAARHAHRQLWWETGNELRRDDPLVLVRRVLEDGDIVAGLRDREEVLRLPEAGVVLRLWVERDVPPDTTVTFTRYDCDLVVDNEHPEDPTPLYDRLARLAGALEVTCRWPSAAERAGAVAAALRTPRPAAYLAGFGLGDAELLTLAEALGPGPFSVWRDDRPRPAGPALRVLDGAFAGVVLP